MLLQNNAVDLVMPDRQAILETELSKVIAGIGGVLGFAGFSTADCDHATVRQVNGLGEVIEHDHAPKRGGQSGDEQPVIAPGNGAGNCSGGITTQAIGCQPFAS